MKNIKRKRKRRKQQQNTNKNGKEKKKIRTLYAIFILAGMRLGFSYGVFPKTRPIYI